MKISTSGGIWASASTQKLLAVSSSHLTLSAGYSGSFYSVFVSEIAAVNTSVLSGKEKLHFGFALS